MMQKFHILQSWCATRRSLAQSQADLQRRRCRLWGALQGTLSRTPALASYSGRSLAEFPVVSSADIRADIGQWNSAGISHDAAHLAAARAETGGSGEVLPGIIAGYSTGTSGKRGIFLANERERAIYLGQSAAKLLPLKVMLGGRIMLFLRANSRLYSDSEGSGLLRFCYGPLSLTSQEKLDAVNAFKPTVLVAPSHVLLELALAGYRQTSLMRCFYGAEPMGEEEREWIAGCIGVKPNPIYQATEGFLGYSCADGQLHLNEDSLEFELAPVPGTPGHQIIVTDLLRKTQPIVRVKLDDYIELEQKPCSCGFAGRTVRPVSGRVQNLWRFRDRVITPEQVTSTLEKSLGASRKWQAVASRDNVHLRLELSIPNELAQRAAQILARSLRLECPIEIDSISDNDILSKRHRVLWREAYV
jgi:putative adenylate-forming enzyme